MAILITISNLCFSVALAVGLGLIAGLIVIAIYFLVQFFRLRSSTGNSNSKYKYDRLTSDPRVRSRTIIQQEIPSFYLPNPVPIALQQPVREERTDSISKGDYRNGQKLLSPKVHSVYVGKKEEDRGTSSIQLNAINTGSISTPQINTPKSPRKTSAPLKKQSLDESTPLLQHRKVAVYKRKPDYNCGKLDFSVYHDQSFRLLQIYVTSGIKVSSPDSDIPPDSLVIVTLSCNEKQIWEQKTQTVTTSMDPQFNEKLEAHGITTAKLQESILYFQLFDSRLDKVIGGLEYPLKNLPPNKLINQTLPLSPVRMDETEEEKLEVVQCLYSVTNVLNFL